MKPTTLVARGKRGQVQFFWRERRRRCQKNCTCPRFPNATYLLRHLIHQRKRAVFPLDANDFITRPTRPQIHPDSTIPCRKVPVVSSRSPRGAARRAEALTPHSTAHSLAPSLRGPPSRAGPCGRRLRGSSSRCSRLRRRSFERSSCLRPGTRPSAWSFRPPARGGAQRKTARRASDRTERAPRRCRCHRPTK